MSPSRVLLLTALTMVAFAGNSLLCRLALRDTMIDAAAFTWVRIGSGALALWVIVCLRKGGGGRLAGDWLSAFALVGYAIAFSYAYVSLPAGLGALLLFGAVQATMIGYGLYTGERLGPRQVGGLLLAAGGLVGLLLPGLSAPPLLGSALMLLAGVGWGIYSLRGRGAKDPIAATAGNFLMAVPFAAVLVVFGRSYDAPGIAYAVVSGALTSGVGYSIWYAALPQLKATIAATVQLSVPVIAAVGGILFLGEHVTLRLGLASVAILGGIALVVVKRRTA